MTRMKKYICVFLTLELLGGNQVKLNVADAYLQFAKANEITEFINFYWLKNAFIVDYMAEELEAAGFTGGIISSFDGFQRNLGATKGSYSQNNSYCFFNSFCSSIFFTFKNIGVIPKTKFIIYKYIIPSYFWIVKGVCEFKILPKAI